MKTKSYAVIFSVFLLSSTLTVVQPFNNAQGDGLPGWQSKVVVKILNPAPEAKQFFPVDIMLDFETNPMDASNEVRVLMCDDENVEIGDCTSKTEISRQVWDVVTTGGADDKATITILPDMSANAFRTLEIYYNNPVALAPSYDMVNIDQIAEPYVVDEQLYKIVWSDIGGDFGHSMHPVFDKEFSAATDLMGGGIFRFPKSHAPLVAEVTDGEGFIFRTLSHVDGGGRDYRITYYKGSLIRIAVDDTRPIEFATDNFHRNRAYWTGSGWNVGNPTTGLCSETPIDAANVDRVFFDFVSTDGTTISKGAYIHPVSGSVDIDLRMGQCIGTTNVARQRMLQFGLLVEDAQYSEWWIKLLGSSTNLISNGRLDEYRINLDNPIQVVSISSEINNSNPDCSSATPSIATLWPPNHRMKSINIDGVTDPDGDPVTIMITSIFQDEPVDAKGNGDGNTKPDGAGVGSGTAQVRAERSGTGDGRVYNISFTADDGSGGSCSGIVLVSVPHDKKSVAVDQGALFDSTSP